MTNNPDIAIDPRWAAARCDEPARGLPVELRLGVAIAVAIALNIVVAGLFTTLVEQGDIKTLASPLAFTHYAQAMAYCGLSAIWAARAAWPSHLRSLAAFVLCVATWAILLPPQISGSDVAGVWAASLGLQALLTTLAARGLELGIKRSLKPLQGQFTIASLLIWMTVIGCMLALSRWVWSVYQWTPQRLAGSNLFPELQAVAIANVVLDVVLLACVRLPGKSTDCILRCVIAIPLVAAAATLIRHLLFHGGFRPLAIEYWWLMTAQGLFVAGTLLPLEIARRATCTEKRGASTAAK
jgi:hypothetical protein